LSEKALGDFFSKVMKTGRYHIGLREVLKNLKDARLVVVSSSLSEEELASIEEGLKGRSVPLIRYEGDSVKLGRVCGLPFRVKAVSVRHPGEASIRKLLKSMKG